MCTHDNFTEFPFKSIGTLACIFCSTIYTGGVVLACMIHTIIYVPFTIVAIETISTFTNISIPFVDTPTIATRI